MARKVFSARNLSAIASISAAGFSRIVAGAEFVVAFDAVFVPTVFAEFDVSDSSSCEQPTATAASNINGIRILRFIYFIGGSIVTFASVS